MLGHEAFSWRYVSETPGLLSGKCGMIVRAEPAVRDHDLAGALFVVGGRSGRDAEWLPRLHQMQRLGRPVALLSDAATAYIKRTTNTAGNLTTHWHDALSLRESGHYPKLTNALSELSAGVVTAAGSGATMELVIAQIAPHLSAADVAELSNRLMLSVLRSPQSEQPKDITKLPALSDQRLKRTVEIMEGSLDLPFNVYELAQEVHVSTRHLERMFKHVFHQTPARFYKQLRTKKARTLIEETQLSMVEISVATGFGTSSSLNKAVRKQYGLSPKQLRLKR
jgi:transcriptional regulator GlxA family with amidase domain